MGLKIRHPPAGFRLPAAEAVLSGMIPDLAMADILTSLSDNRVLLRTIPDDGEIRYSLLYVIQQFALDQLRGMDQEAHILPRTRAISVDSLKDRKSQ